ncbi:hypothetical protein ACGFJT_36765 [Actinomadura geliboluensis]|uniref:hypothetical protein n=1 Tax=Actinomadura geliboluensis TaxID=882440 RepID=UPI0037194DF1
MISGITVNVPVSIVYAQTTGPEDAADRAVETACRVLDAGLDARRRDGVILDIARGEPLDQVPFAPSGDYPTGPAPAAVLAEQAAAAGITAGDLDDAVHDAASEHASRVNDDGPRAQLEFLIDAYGVEEARTILDGLAGRVRSRS